MVDTFVDKFIDKIYNIFNEKVLTRCPPSITVPVENIDFTLQDIQKETFRTEYVFTTSFNEHCYVVYEKSTGKLMQPLHLSHGRKTFIHEGVVV